MEKNKEKKESSDCVLCNQESTLGFLIHSKFVCLDCLSIIRALHEHDFEVLEKEYFDGIGYGEVGKNG